MGKAGRATPDTSEATVNKPGDTGITINANKVVVYACPDKNPPQELSKGAVTNEQFRNLLPNVPDADALMGQLGKGAGSMLRRKPDVGEQLRPDAAPGGAGK
jgi:hypothetical protein